MTEIIGKKPDFTRPVLFLDFDDVLNIFSDDVRKDPSGFCQKTVVFSKGSPKPHGGLLSANREICLIWKEEVAAILRDLNAIWISSWKHFSQSVLNPLLGFDFGYADWKYRGFSNPSHDGKRLAIEEIVEDNHIPAFAIADDSFFQGESNMIIGVDGLVKAPQYGGTGLSVDEALEIKEFLEADHTVPFHKLRFQELKNAGYSGRIHCIAYLDKEKNDGEIDDPFFCFETVAETLEYLRCKEISGICDSRDFSSIYQLAIAYVELKDGNRISDGVEELV